MAEVFQGATCLDGWKAVVESLLGGSREASNLLIVISDPCGVSDEWLYRYNPRSVGAGYDSIRDVANTIFPLRTYENAASRDQFYARYCRALARRRHLHPGVWGTYFHRLIDFGTSHVNQLERAISAMRAWERNHKSVVVLHTSSAETDGIRTRGGPCLQYVQLNCPDPGTVDIVAVYRNHDYFNKALGNFIGLARLLRFVCEAIAREPGSLTCHSVHAFLGAPRSRVSDLLNS